jgi:3',5'-nucleoside bisphosphate phosphatase
VIDLHMHTTASDGRCAPADLVARVQAAGLETFAITDHDTVAALPEARRLAADRALTLVPGIEITAVCDGRDVHVLGYWCDETDTDLLAFLIEQRARRVARLERIGHALARAGAPVDVARLLDDAAARPGAAVGRPGLARALVQAGHAASVQDAFDRLLGEGRPAYVPRSGVAPEEVFAIVHHAGGLASLAHPGVTRRDDLLARWADGGADALEAFHSDQDAGEQARYLEAARQLGLAVSGGSDFHGDDPASSRSTRRALGGVTLPAAQFTRLTAAHAERTA